MAASAGFKQQCPSCEAMVPIKNRTLIGKKIDCHKCKYRFVVEDPGEDEEDADEAVETSSAKGDKKKVGAAGVTAKAPGKGPAGKSGANGKPGTAVKKKPGRARDEDDDEEEASPQPKES